ncbi:MAG: glycosyltransferase family 2 protein [Pseudomonadota bacterium]
MTSPPPEAPELSVIVPVRDEADNILPLIAEIDQALAGRWTFETIYVDDGSSDGTGQRLKEARATYPHLRVVTHARSCGQSAALLSGARMARGRILVTLDGDGQNDPADIPKLLEVQGETEAGPAGCMTTGLRLKRQDTAVRRVASRWANGIRQALLKDDIRDSACGLRAFPRETFLRMAYFDHIHRFLPAMMIREGGVVVGVPVNHRPRERGTSKYGLTGRLMVGVVDLFGVYWLLRRRKLAQIIEEKEQPL